MAWSSTGDIYSSKRIVLGCGNLLFGDDAFGPLVAQRLAEEGVPQDTAAVDAGTGVRDILFDILLLETKPEKVVIVDALDIHKAPGTVFLVDLEQIPCNKLDDFSLHQVPTSNMLRELKESCNIEVVVVACQPAFIPDEIKMGISPEVRSAIGEAVRLIREILV